MKELLKTSGWEFLRSKVSLYFQQKWEGDNEKLNKTVFDSDKLPHKDKETIYANIW